MLYVLSRFIFVSILKVLFKVRIHKGYDRLEGPVLVVSNHASLADPPLLAMVANPRKVDFMAKKELFDIPLIGIWTKNVRCIPVKRDSKGTESLKQAIRRIKEGHVVGIFPEGTRSADGRIRPAKKGVGFLVAKTKAPVLVVYIKNSGKALSPEGFKIGTEVDVYAEKPIPYEEIVKHLDGKKPYEGIADFITSRLIELKEKAEQEKK